MPCLRAEGGVLMKPLAIAIALAAVLPACNIAVVDCQQQPSHPSCRPQQPPSRRACTQQPLELYCDSQPYAVGAGVCAIYCYELDGNVVTDEYERLTPCSGSAARSY